MILNFTKTYDIEDSVEYIVIQESDRVLGKIAIPVLNELSYVHGMKKSVLCFDIVLNNYTLYDNMILKDEIRYLEEESNYFEMIDDEL